MADDIPDWGDIQYGRVRREPDAVPVAPTPSGIPDWNTVAVNPPAPPAAPGGGQPFGELKPYTPSWTETFKNAVQDALSAGGAKPGTAQHLSEGLTGIASMTPGLGTGLAAADLTYHLPRGQYMSSLFDLLGAAPAYGTAKRLIRGAPAQPLESPVEQALREQTNRPVLRTAATPTDEELANSARTGYAAIRQAPLQYDPNYPLADAIKAYIEHPTVGGFSPEKSRGIHSTLDRVTSAWQQRGQPVTPDALDTLRQQLRGLPDPGVEHAVRALDHYMGYPPAGALLAGSPSTLDTIRQYFNLARGEWRAHKTGEMVDTAIDRGDLNTASSHSGLNQDNATRAQLRATIMPNLRTGDIPLWGAQPNEVNAIRGVIEGTPTINRQRYYGNQLGGGGGIGKSIVAGGLGSSVAGAAALHFGLDPVTAGGIATAAGAVPYIAGGALRRAANEGTNRGATEAADFIRRNSPMFRAREAASPPIVDPRSQLREAIGYALAPQARDVAQSYWDQLNANQ